MPRMCPREGCDRRVRGSGYTHCSAVCSALDAEFARLQSLPRTVSTAAGTAAWVALVEAADHWTAYLRARAELFSDVRKQSTS
ncbi:hypothetical protein A5664_01685 [Mycolicibacterium fortuitum]|nr:hypothetical protein A5664_01685 [Mycolicibacterium fortuitum]